MRVLRKIFTTRTALLFALATMASACEYCEETLLPLVPYMIVDPLEHRVLGAGVAQDTPITTAIINRSNVPLTIDSIALDEAAGDVSFRLQEPLPTEVPAGESVEVVVLVRPIVVGQIKTTLIIDGEDAALPTPHVEVPITVDAVDRGLPDIEVDPEAFDFERVGQFDVTSANIDVSNVGVRDLIIDLVDFVPDVAGDESIQIRNGIQPDWPIAPTEVVTVGLVFAPEDTLTHCGNVVIASNDPDENPVEVPVCGTGSECPVAVAELLEDPEDIEPLDTIRFYGGDSYTETQGASIEGYEWRLSVRPPGSTAVLDTPLAEQTRLTVDIAGTYEACLEVTDNFEIRSCVDECVRVDVIPTEELHVQLVWDHPRADLDLHLLNEGGSVFTHEGDCYFSNRQPEWFTPLEANPSLDADDNGGYGPENTNIVRPNPSSRWRALVHYWNKQTDGDPFTLATLRVYAYGQLVGEFQQSFDNDETLWRAVEIVWSSTPPTPEAPIGEPPTLNVIGQVEPFARPF